MVLVTDITMFHSGIDLVLELEDKSIKNNKEFFTDSNGLFEMKRQKRDKWETSVFPCNSYWYIKDESNKKMTYFTEVAQGVISPSEGNMVIYLQRSAIVDDDKGVNEVLKVSEHFMTESWLLLYDNED